MQDEMQPSWIDTADGLRQFCRSLGDGPIAVDTESDHFHAYQARVCLIQLASDHSAALVDPLELDNRELAPLFELFEDPAITKVLHSARNDINELDRDYGVGITSLFDTQIAARFLDYDRNSLDWMLENILNVDTGKAFSRYDWTTRPLPDKALKYATDDVRHLLELRGRFVGELQAEGWDAAFGEQCKFITESVEFVPKDFDPEGWRELGGASKLDGRSRAALSKLYRWRHRLCGRLNRSAVTLLPNRTLMYLAKNRPQAPGNIDGLKGVSDSFVDDYADDIIEVVREARSIDAPPKKHPDRQKGRRRGPSGDQKVCYNALRSWRNETADRLGIPTEFIATNATLSEIAERPPQSDAELRDFEAILGWHVEMFGGDIIDIVTRAPV